MPGLPDGPWSDVDFAALAPARACARIAGGQAPAGTWDALDTGLAVPLLSPLLEQLRLLLDGSMSDSRDAIRRSLLTELRPR